MIHRLSFLALLAAPLAAADGQGGWLPASPEALPRWRGFNLLEKFHKDWNNKPFVEDDFKWIAELGFNFVRLPMDYRCWIADGDWTKFNEAALRDIDQAVAWGERYGIHVMLNFHRAPGYTVASPKEATNLWTDAETQRVCALHWATFARRYKGIPSARLSFNLFNEPAGVDEAAYVAVARRMAEAIRAEDPQRLIVSDGLQWGNQPILSLKELRIAQATRGYQPFQLTHYEASWVDSKGWPRPEWPRLLAPGQLYAPGKGGMGEGVAGAPLVVEGPFDRATVLRLHVGVVSARADLEVRADGRSVWSKSFVCGPGEGEWKEARYQAQWNIWQNLYDRDYEALIPAGTKRVEVALTGGDWLQLGALGIEPQGGRETRRTLLSEWNKLPGQLTWDATTGTIGGRLTGREALFAEYVAPWVKAREAGIGVMVGEWGSFNKTPHEVTLAWMEDCLKNWREAGLGWALWNFRGSFGILDSGRADVVYEEWRGHKLDRAMLELLQRY